VSALSIIISREFKERVHKKSFIVTTILAPILMVALMALPALISYFSTPGLRKIAVIDHSGIVLPDLLKSAQDVEYLTFVPTDESLDKALANENYQDVLVIGADIDENPSNVKLYNHETGSVEIENQINHVVEKSVSTYRMTRYNIPNIDQILADSKVECSLQTIRVSDDGEEEDTSTMISTLLGISMTFILYMFLLMYGQMVMSSIIEEKGNRVLELVVTSVKPTQLMMGKIIGVGLVAVLQIAIWAVFVTLASSVLMPMLISDSVASQISMYNAGTLDMAGTDNVEMIQALSMFTSVGKILMLFVYMKIPILYILPANHAMIPKERNRISAETQICQSGIPNGIRAIITMGLVNGIIEVHKAIVLLGSVPTDIAMTMPSIIGIVTNVASCELSWTLSTDEPMAANIAA